MEGVWAVREVEGDVWGKRVSERGLWKRTFLSDALHVNSYKGVHPRLRGRGGDGRGWWNGREGGILSLRERKGEDVVMEMDGGRTGEGRGSEGSSGNERF